VAGLGIAKTGRDELLSRVAGKLLNEWELQGFNGGGQVAGVTHIGGRRIAILRTDSKQIFIVTVPRRYLCARTKKTPKCTALVSATRTPAHGLLLGRPAAEVDARVAAQRQSQADQAQPGAGCHRHHQRAAFQRRREQESQGFVWRHVV